MVSTFEEYVAADDNSINGDFLNETTWFAQTFTIGTVGDNLTFNLSNIKVKIGNDSNSGTPTIAVEIYNVLPDGKPDIDAGAISTGSYINDGANGVNEWKSVDMTSVTLKASEKYAIIQRETSSGITRVTSWRGTSANGYAGGSVYITTDSGSTWSIAAANALDANFQINGGSYEGTLCTLADAVNKAGVNASSSATNESLVSDWVKQAEGQICATTRFDWVSAYSGLSEQVKYLLNRVASSMAAIDIINYDLVPSGGAQDRVTSETMINVHRESVALGLSLLRDKQVEAFITGDS